MKRMLTRLGCDVSTAENGLIALELILGEKPTPMTEAESMTPPANAVANMSNTPSSENAEDDRPRIPDPRYEVIFLDNQMPVMSGLESVAKMRAAGRTDLVVGVTGKYLTTFLQEILLIFCQATRYSLTRRPTWRQGWTSTSGVYIFCSSILIICLQCHNKTGLRT